MPKKKKEIEDFKPTTYQIKKPKVIDDWSEIKSTYCFKTDFPLEQKIKDALELYQHIQKTDEKQPKLGQKKERLGKIYEKSSELLNLIENSGYEISNHLRHPFGMPNKKNKQNEHNKPTSSPELLERITKDLKELKNRACIAKDCVPKDKGKRPSDDALKNFICNLADVYEEGILKQATCGWDEPKSKGVGDFFKFVEKIICSQQIKSHSKQSLAKFISRVLTERRKRRSKK